MTLNDLSVNELSRALIGQLEQPARAGEAIDDATLQRLLGHAVRAYSRRVNSGDLAGATTFFAPYPEDLDITATEAATTAAALLRAAEITTFEIAAMFNL